MFQFSYIPTLLHMATLHKYKLKRIPDHTWPIDKAKNNKIFGYKQVNALLWQCISYLCQYECKIMDGEEPSPGCHWERLRVLHTVLVLWTEHLADPGVAAAHAAHSFLDPVTSIPATYSPVLCSSQLSKPRRTQTDAHFNQEGNVNS